jgi:hypothetical protein
MLAGPFKQTKVRGGGGGGSIKPRSFILFASSMSNFGYIATTEIELFFKKLTQVSSDSNPNPT